LLAITFNGSHGHSYQDAALTYRTILLNNIPL